MRIRHRSGVQVATPGEQATPEARAALDDELWALLVASALIFMLKVYEERELELRFVEQ